MAAAPPPPRLTASGKRKPAARRMPSARARAPGGQLGRADAEVAGPGLRSAPGSGFRAAPGAARPDAWWEGAGLHFGVRGAGAIALGGEPGLPLPERGTSRLSAGGDGASEAGVRKEGSAATSSGTPAPSPPAARSAPAPRPWPRGLP